MMGFFNWLGGMVWVEVVSADVPAFLLAVGSRGLELRDVEMPDALTVRFSIPRNRLKLLIQLTGHRGEKMTVLRRRGLWYRLEALRRRPVLTLGLGLLTALALFLPTRVLLVEVEGNTTIPSNRIIETAAQCGISFGASRRAVRSERVKNALLEAMPELSWAGVNTYGSRAVITVRQREVPPQTEAGPSVSSIVADRDGFILTCQAERGTAQCVPGQAVTEGQVLICGYTDCGICTTATRAVGEVFAATNRQITGLTPDNCLKATGQSRDKVTYSLILGKNRFNFYKSSGISLSTCGRMVTEYILTLPGGFALPVKLLKETISHREFAEAEVEETTASQLLTACAREYLSQQMIAGTVTAALETLRAENGCWVLAGNYACTEMIGRERAEQNGELHETSGTNRECGPGG